MRRRAALVLAVSLVRAGTVLAQAPPQPPVLSSVPTPTPGAVPEPAQMSGYPLQVGDLPPGVVAVRVIRRNFGDNVAGQTVRLRVGDDGPVRDGVTSADGRAQFTGLRVGDRVQLRATVDGEQLNSQTFEIPPQGGVRMVLVAGVGSGRSTADTWPTVDGGDSTRETRPAGAAQPVVSGSGPDRTIRAATFAVIGIAFVAISIVLSRRQSTLRTQARTNPVKPSLAKPESVVGDRRAEVFDALVEL